MRQRLLLAAIAAASFLVLPAMVTGETITAYFEDALGQSTAYVDAYRGKTGGGWTGGWTSLTTSGTGTNSANVVDPDPLHDGDGNHLYVTAKKTGGTGAYMVGFVRDYKTAAALDFMEDFTIQYSVRIDDEYFDNDVNYDQVAFRIAKANYHTSQAEDPIDIFMRGSGSWVLIDGIGGTITTNPAEFGVIPGDVYDVFLTVHVADKTYDVEIENATTGDSYGDSGYKTKGLGWRAGTSLEKYIGFFAHETTTNETREFSVDNIRIAVVPEPAALVMGLGLLVAGLIARRRG